MTFSYICSECKKCVLANVIPITDALSFPLSKKGGKPKLNITYNYLACRYMYPRIASRRVVIPGNLSQSLNTKRKKLRRGNVNETDILVLNNYFALLQSI